MNDLAKFSVAKAIPAKVLKLARPGLAPGIHPVDMTFRVKGNMTVGEDFTTAGTAKLCKNTLIAALCYCSGATGPAGVRLLRRAAALVEAAEAGDMTMASVLKDLVPAIADVEREVVQPMIDSLPRIPCKGKITTDLEVTLV